MILLPQKEIYSISGHENLHLKFTNLFSFLSNKPKNVTRHNKTGHLSFTKKIVIFLLSERAFYQLKGDTSPV